MMCCRVFLLFLVTAGGLFIKESVQEDINNNVTFYLFTRENNSSHIYLNESNLDALNFSNKIVFLIHGWHSNWTANEYYEPLKNILLDKDDVNVIEVDYSPIASLVYEDARAQAPEVGDAIGDFLLTVQNYLQNSLKDFQLIGHSLGGQISGFAGKRIIGKTNTTIGKIVALDPSGRLFYNDSVRLVPTDADIVEVIHTDGGVFGYYEKCGTVDFYANGGKPPQPGCPEDPDLDYSQKCSHHRSYKYYIEALGYGGFTSTKCSSYSEYVDGSCEGNDELKIADDITANDEDIYFLSTNAEPLYSKG